MRRSFGPHDALRALPVGASVIAASSLLAFLLGREAVCAITLGLSVALCAAMALWLLRHPAVPERRVLLEDALLLTGRQTVEAVLAPCDRCDRPRVNGGPSMLLLGYAALLTAPDALPDGAVERYLAPLRLSRGALEQAMPLVDTVARDGLLWQLRRDGNDLRAFCCAPWEELLPVCRRIQQLRPTLLRRADREALETALASRPIPPLCFAMAEVTDGIPGEAIWLGALLPCEELYPWAAEELVTLRHMGFEPFLREPLASRLHAPAEDGTCLPLGPLPHEGSAAPVIAPGERPSAVLSRLLREQHIVLIRLLQLLWLQFPVIVGGWLLSPLPVGVLSACTLLLAALLPMPGSPTDTGAIRLLHHRRYPVAYAAVMLLVTVGAVLMGLFLRSAGIVGGCGALLFVPLTAALYLAVVRQVGMRWRSAALAAPVLAILTAILSSVLCGCSLTAAAFSLLTGCLLTVLALLITRAVRAS